MDTPREPVVETPSDSPTDSPADAPVQSPAEVPAETPAEDQNDDAEREIQVHEETSRDETVRESPQDALPVDAEGAPQEDPAHAPPHENGLDVN